MFWAEGEGLVFPHLKEPEGALSKLSKEIKVESSTQALHCRPFLHRPQGSIGVGCWVPPEACYGHIPHESWVRTEVLRRGGEWCLRDS